MVNIRRLTIFVFCGFVCGLGTAQDAQTDSAKGRSQDGVTILGTFVLPKEHAGAIQVSSLPVKLLEDVYLPPLPLPENWQEMASEDQNKWWEEFQQSERGKTFFTERQQLLDNAKNYDVRIEPNGDFKVYDIPAGRYQLHGLLNKTINEIDFAFEVFGAITIAEEADEVVMGKIEVMVSPLWKSGQTAPAISGQTLDGNSFELKSLAGQNVLVVFWLVDSDHADQFQKALWDEIQKLNPQAPINFISACLDADAARVKAAAEKGEFPGQVVVCGAWDGKVARDYGLAHFPSLWLIGPDQKLKMTDEEFGIARIASQLSLPNIVSKLLANEPIPNYPPEELEDDGSKGGDGVR